MSKRSQIQDYVLKGMYSVGAKPDNAFELQGMKDRSWDLSGLILDALIEPDEAMVKAGMVELGKYTDEFGKKNIYGHWVGEPFRAMIKAAKESGE